MQTQLGGEEHRRIVEAEGPGGERSAVWSVAILIGLYRID